MSNSSLFGCWGPGSAVHHAPRSTVDMTPDTCCVGLSQPFDKDHLNQILMLMRQAD